MAMSKEKTITAIVDTATQLGKKDRCSLGYRLKDWKQNDLNQFECYLKKIANAEEKPSSSKRKISEESEQQSILSKMARKLQENEERGVMLDLKTVSSGLGILAQDIQGQTKAQLIEKGVKLQISIENISIAKALMQFELGRLIHHLTGFRHKMTDIEICQAFTLTRRKANEYLDYYRMCLEYPGLLACSYTMGTVTRLYSSIQKKAETDERFHELLKMQIEVIDLLTEGNKRDEKIIRLWFEEGENKHVHFC